MAQPPTSYYANYQQQQQVNQYAGSTADSYAAQYNPSSAQAYGYPDYHQPVRPLSPFTEPPDTVSIDETVASLAMRRLIMNQLRIQGFDSAEVTTIERLECEVAAFITSLFERASSYKDLSNRSGCITTDMLITCEEKDVRNIDLRRTAAGLPKRRTKQPRATKTVTAFNLIVPHGRPRSPNVLPPENDNVPPPVPATLRGLPAPLPKLPPTHTYLRTPIEPPKKAALPSLEKKLKTATLVQGSLRNLMIATEDTTGQEDGELLGHIVNYEVASHPRKRWKV